VFPMRAFHHGAILHHTGSGIRTPKDLEGRRVGVNRGYTVTTGVWARGILQHQYGVDLNSITWVLSGDEHVEEWRPPVNVVSIEPGKRMEDMLASGEIPAAIGVQVDSPQVKPLIPNAAAAGLDALRSRGFYPTNHTVVVKNEVLNEHPELARDLFEAFSEAKRLYLERVDDPMLLEVEAIIGDPLPYGIEPNRKMLEAIVQYANEQGIIRRLEHSQLLFTNRFASKNTKPLKRLSLLTALVIIRIKPRRQDHRFARSQHPRCLRR